MIQEKYRIKETFRLAGIPGFLLIGYYIIQFAFARGKTDMATVDASAVVFALYALGCGLYSFRLLCKGINKEFFNWAFLESPIKWFGLYTLLCLVSSLWSSMVVLSAYRAVECLGLLLLNMAVICTLIHRCTFQQVMLWSVTYAFLNVLLTFGVGLTSSLNYALYKSQFPATIFFYLAFYLAPTRYIKYPMMIVAFLCRSVTGYVGMALGMCSLMFGNRRYKILGIVLGTGIVIATSTMGVEEFLNQTIFASKGGVVVDGKIDENKTSGRMSVWENTNKIMESQGKQWTGTGFTVGEMMIARKLNGTGAVIGMHNGFLSAYVGTGYIGLLLFSLFMLSVVRLVLKNHIPKEYKAVLIACICVVLLHTYGNPGLGFRVYGTWMPAMFVIMLMVGSEYKSKILDQDLNEVDS